MPENALFLLLTSFQDTIQKKTRGGEVFELIKDAEVMDRSNQIPESHTPKAMRQFRAHGASG